MKTLIFILGTIFFISGGESRSVEEIDSGISDLAAQHEHNILEIYNSYTLEQRDLLNTITCSACEELMDNALEVIHSGNVTYQDVHDHVIDMCMDIPAIGNYEVCSGFINISMPSFSYVLNHTEDIDGNLICGTLFVIIGCTYDNDTHPDRYWEVQIDTTKPDVTEPVYDNSVATMKILQLADTHFDPLYFPGGNANCSEKYLCCRNDSGMPATEEDKAGFWGDYRNCDAPKWLLELMYQHIVDTHPDIDFIIWTGDVVPHNLWSTTKSSNLDIIAETADMIKEYFQDTPVFPALGNHEGHPSNTFAQPYVAEAAFDISWLYDEMNVIWSDWLPNSTSYTITYGGYYSTEIMPGLKIISVNSNYCYGFNWWLIMDDNDIANILEFMINELQASEDAGEKVYIISHHPSGSFDCGMTWSHEYNRIISRYQDTITGLFYGHTHNDHFHLFFDPDDPASVDPYEIGYIAQSQTPYSFLNPGYKIYHVEGDFDGSYHRVLDHENWVMDLDMANTMNITTFFKLYSARDEYDLVDLSPASWLNLVKEMNQSNSLYFDLFYRNYVKAAQPSLEEGCDARCKESVLCQLLVSDNSDHSRCDYIAQE